LSMVLGLVTLELFVLPGEGLFLLHSLLVQLLHLGQFSLGCARLPLGRLQLHRQLVDADLQLRHQLLQLLLRSFQQGDRILGLKGYTAKL